MSNLIAGTFATMLTLSVPFIAYGVSSVFARFSK